MSTQIDDKDANPELWAALVEAQGKAQSVGKDGRNSQRGYNYATTENVVREARALLSGAGLAFFHSFATESPPDQKGDIGKQHVCAVVRIGWRLVHQAGGVVRGEASMSAIGSPARPNEKAEAATVTYALGFILRGMLLLDRAEEDSIAVDKREEPEPDPLWNKFVQMRGRVCAAERMSEKEAYWEMAERAGVSPGDKETDAELRSMIEAGTAILDPAKPSQAPAKPKQAAKPKTPRPDDDATNDAFALWISKSKAHVAYRTADWKEAHGESPPKTTKDEIRREALGISERAIKVEPGKFPKDGSGTAEAYTLAADALDQDLERRKATG